MRIEVIKMTLQKRENSGNNLVPQIERPLKIYSKISFAKTALFFFICLFLIFSYLI